MALRVSSRFPTTIDIDGEPIRLSIARLTLDQWTDFSQRFMAHGRDGARGERAVDRKRLELLAAVTPEQMAERRRELHETRKRQAIQTAGDVAERLNQPVQIPDVAEPSDEDVRATFEPTPVQIAAALEAELAPEALKEQRAKDLEAQKEGNAFTLESIRAYVTVEPDQIFDEDSRRYITSGEDLVAVFGSRPDVLVNVMAEIYLMNRLSESAKKKLQLQRALRRGSKPAETAPGPTPAPTAANADASDTAAPAAATA